MTQSVSLLQKGFEYVDHAEGRLEILATLHAYRLGNACHRFASRALEFATVKRSRWRSLRRIGFSLTRDRTVSLNGIVPSEEGDYRADWVDNDDYEESPLVKRRLSSSLFAQLATVTVGSFLFRVCGQRHGDKSR